MTYAGVFKDDGPYSRYISLERITTLQDLVTTDASIEIGARVSLTRCIQEFHRVSTGVSAMTGYEHLVHVAKHWQLVANLSVRNVSDTEKTTSRSLADAWLCYFAYI